LDDTISLQSSTYGEVDWIEVRILLGSKKCFNKLWCTRVQNNGASYDVKGK